MSKVGMIHLKENVPYEKGLALQEQAFQYVKESDQYDGLVLMLEHKPVYTYGSQGGNENLKISEEGLRAEGYELYETRRGGNVTYHGPGQLTVYPIINLRAFKKDAHWYIRMLEEVIIKVLGEYGILGYRKPAYVGVWVEDAKIAAIGVHMKRWITLHGFALNVVNDTDDFKKINPCGITEFEVATMKQFHKNISFDEVLMKIEAAFSEVFACELERLPEDFLGGQDE